ncbi:T9SS sorting signal type C domain-containing protein, partial [Flavobacterium sp.]|uniref:T9SS sorting signal type C domain-containing protein n=1 Tax=Flavobacterium sp. TaxID=239 RepID=UPI002488CF05
GTPTASGAFNYTVTTTGGCPPATTTGTITVNGALTAATISGSAAICSGSATNIQVAITGGLSPYTVVYTTGSVSSYASGTNISVAPTSTTNYTITSVTDANGCVGTGNSGTATVTLTSTSSSDGISWTNGAPTGTKDAVLTGASPIVLGADLNACSLTVNGPAVSVTSGFDVTLIGAMTVSSGSFTLNNNANLIQNNSNYTNSGNIIVKRNTSALKRLDYTLWSSPVTGQGIYAFSPFTFANRFYAYRTNTNVFNTADVGMNVTGLDANGVNGTDANSIPFSQAKGYLIRMPWNHPTAPAIWNGSFTGVPNNGNITYTLTNGGAGNRFNLVGNPYPSPIDAVAFVTNTNNNTITTGTLYFWRKTNNALSPSYCTWTLGGFVTNGEAQVFDPNDVIQTGQGFFVEGTGSGTVNFDNTMRINNHANQFFRTTAATTTNTTLERNRIWLNATNATGLFSQAMVGYITNATQGVDAAIDGKYINDGDIALTSLIDDVPYAIQGRALPFDASDVVPMNFKVSTAGNYTIAIDHVDGLFTAGTQLVYLKDNLTATIHNLSGGAYTFTSDAGTFNNRFELVYQTQLTNPVFTVNAVVIYNHNNAFVVNSGNFTMSSIKVFDIRGRLIEEKTGINANETTIKGGLANQVLLVQITTEDGVVVTKKVIR